jgi:branched-chain amino acid transport system permease protein
VNLASNLIVSGVVSGCIFALAALGFVMLYRATRVFSLAQGSFMVYGATILYSAERLGAPWALAVVIAIAATAIIGAAVYRFFFSGRMLGAEALTVAIATIGLATLADMLADLIWGANPLSLPRTPSFRPLIIGGVVRFNQADLVTIVVACVLVGAAMAVFRWTRLGLRMRATADSAGLAVYAGVNVRRIGVLAWGLGAACAALAGAVYSLGVGQVDPDSISSLGLLAFPAILLGGLESVGGALLGGVVMGLASAIGGYFLGSQWEPVIPYMCLFIILLVKPTGLFGARGLGRL